jgi:hypothetical protein
MQATPTSSAQRRYPSIMISFDHAAITKGTTAALFILLITMIGIASGNPLPIAPSQSKRLALLMQTQDRSAMLSSSGRPTAIPEQAETQPESFCSIFWFKPISKQAPPTAGKQKPLLSFKYSPVIIPRVSEQATQTAGRPSFKPIAFQIQTIGEPSNSSSLMIDDCTSPSFQTTGKPSNSSLMIDDCSSPSFISQFQIETSVDLPLHSTATNTTESISRHLDRLSTATEALIADPIVPSSSVAGAPRRPTSSAVVDPTNQSSTVVSVDLPLRSTATVADPLQRPTSPSSPTKSSVDLPRRSTATVAGPPQRLTSPSSSVTTAPVGTAAEASIDLPLHSTANLSCLFLV